MAWDVNIRRAVYGLISLYLLGLPGNSALRPLVQGPALLLAPMMDLTPCLLASQAVALSSSSGWVNRCRGPKASAAHLVESTLRKLQPHIPEDSAWQLGYTLQVPLLSLMQPVENDWQVNRQAVEAVVQTVVDSPRPLVLYLFSTHFGVNAPIEPVLAKNPDNMAHTPSGPLPTDLYYGAPIYPWSLARTDNPVTHYRARVIEALLEGVCALPTGVRRRIKGVTLLGEVHHLFPNFESGMGFGGHYSVSDYSSESVAGFRNYLRNRFARIELLNEKMGSDYPSFEAVSPPAKDIRRETLARYEEHMDAYAAGQLPITGWVHAPSLHGSGQAVRIYLNGKPLADAPVHLSRQDVRTARPEFNTADVGWRFDLDYRLLPAGVHRIDLALSQPEQDLMHLGTRFISIMDKRQSTPVALPFVALPVMQPLPAHFSSYTDEPRDQSAYYFNPMAREWQKFRESQVVHYLQYFNNLIAQSCLSDTPRYTHQIVPQFNPGWDRGKFAVGASLQPMKNLRTGVSLYGETSYGRSFADWFRKYPRRDYGVTELHPLQALDTGQLRSLLNQHRDNGAGFMSFFLETRWGEERVSTMPNLFSFDPDNTQHGSDVLFESMRSLLAE